MAAPKYHSHVDAHLREVRDKVNRGINALRQLQGFRGTPREEITPEGQARLLAVVKDAAAGMPGIRDYKGNPDPVPEPKPEAVPWA